VPRRQGTLCADVRGSGAVALPPFADCRRGVRVEDIVGPKARKLHKLTPWAHADGLRITYPPGPVSAPAQASAMELP